MSTTESQPEFTLTRTLDAPRELVWRAWTDESELAAWLPNPLESVAFDVREGGRYQYTMIDPQTAEKFPTGGVYLEVVPFERLVFTWGNPDEPADSASVATVTLDSDGERTQMTFHLRGFAGYPGDEFVYDGWSDTLDTLARRAASASRPVH